MNSQWGVKTKVYQAGCSGTMVALKTYISEVRNLIFSALSAMYKCTVIPLHQSVSCHKKYWQHIKLKIWL